MNKIFTNLILDITKYKKKKGIMGFFNEYTYTSPRLYVCHNILLKYPCITINQNGILELKSDDLFSNTADYSIDLNKPYSENELNEGNYAGLVSAYELYIK